MLIVFLMVPERPRANGLARRITIPLSTVIFLTKRSPTATPIFRASDAIAAGSHQFFSVFSDAATLVTRNEQLVNENATLANENQALIQKMSSISALLGSSDTSHGVIAAVVARPPESPYDVIVLEKGSNAGVTKGMEAFGPGSVPLGIVQEVSADFSRVVLFSSPGVSTAGWVGQANVPVTLQGAGGGAMNASLSRSAGINEGDGVFVLGPGMLPIGVVTRVDSDTSSPSITLRIQPAINLFSIGWVQLRTTTPPL